MSVTVHLEKSLDSLTALTQFQTVIFTKPKPQIEPHC